jgi:hypothetical protein
VDVITGNYKWKKRGFQKKFKRDLLLLGIKIIKKSLMVVGSRQ